MAAQVEHLKWIQGTNFMVDGFNFQNPRCRSYFLTHFHSDHTTGAGTVRCFLPSMHQGLHNIRHSDVAIASLAI